MTEPMTSAESNHERLQQITTRCNVAKRALEKHGDKLNSARLSVEIYNVQPKAMHKELRQFLSLVNIDIPFLLAEVERLTAERDAAVKRAEAAERFMQEMADDPNWCRECANLPCFDKDSPTDGGCVGFKWRGPCADNQSGTKPGGEGKK